jgi:flagella basal body P-ring formation protein FlgA
MIRKLLPILLLIATPAFADGMKIVTPTHDIARGEVLSADDVMIGMSQNTILSGNILTRADAVMGMEARRPLRAGEAIAATDLRHPVVVTKGQTVTMTFEAPGVSLTAMGRAMAEGGVGDTVMVQNPASFRMVSAVVTGTGTVRATGPANAVPANTITALK